MGSPPAKEHDGQIETFFEGSLEGLAEELETAKVQPLLPKKSNKDIFKNRDIPRRVDLDLIIKDSGKTKMFEAFVANESSGPKEASAFIKLVWIAKVVTEGLSYI